MIIYLTQHTATPEQIKAGVVDLRCDELTALRGWLTFNSLPTKQDIKDRAATIARLADKAIPHQVDGVEIMAQAMIGGAPYLMGALERALRERGITPMYAFSIREVEEQAQADGSVRKVAVFRHAGFVPA